MVLSFDLLKKLMYYQVFIKIPYGEKRASCDPLNQHLKL